MGEDKIRHLLIKPRPGGGFLHFWNPSRTVRALGLTPEALGPDYAPAKKRALELNALADDMRRFARSGDNGPAPGSMARLFRDYRASDEFAEKKQRTRDDYAYYIDKIEREFGQIAVAAMTAKVIKEYYRRLMSEKGVTWAYHVIGTLRAVLSWAVTEDWIPQNPALDVTIKSPPKRKVQWTIAQTEALVAQARKDGWPSLACMYLVYDCIGQSPVDVRRLRARDYAGGAIASTRAKTGRTDAPIPLWPKVIAALDAYLATRPALHPDAPLFAHDRLGGFWNEQTLAKAFKESRKRAGLPAHLQMQDFRRTAATEAGAASGTVDEIRALQRHSTRTAALHYVHPDDRFLNTVQEKRLALREHRAPKSQND